MSDAIDDLVANAATHHAKFEGPSSDVPARHVAIVTCMDARIDNFEIFDLEPGEAHILRNAGGVVTPDVLRSLVLSQRLLHTREVIVMHHTHCGLLRLDEAALRARILIETGRKPSFAFGAFKNVDRAVRRAVTRVRGCLFLPYRDRIRGFVYEVENGRLREVEV